MTTLLATEHEAGLHKLFQPTACADCFPAGEPIAAPPAAQPVEAAPTSSGMQMLSTTIERMRARFPRLADADMSVLDEPTPPPDGGPPCTTCRGFRFVRRDVPTTDPDFGKALPCPECSRGFLLQQRLDRLWGGLPDLFRGWTLETFCGLSDAHRAIGDEVLATWLDDPALPWLFAWGESGRGKTGLAVAVMHEYTLRGKTTLLKVVPDLLETLRRSYSTRDAYEADGSPWLASLYAADLLVLDDLGSEYHKGPEDWAAEKVFQVIGGRHDRRMRTIITSNYDLPTLKDRLGHSRTPSRIDELAGERWSLDFSRLPNVRRKRANPPANAKADIPWG